KLFRAGRKHKYNDNHTFSSNPSCVAIRNVIIYLADIEISYSHTARHKGLKISYACPNLQAGRDGPGLNPITIAVLLHRRPHSLSENIADSSSSLFTSSL